MNASASFPVAFAATATANVTYPAATVTATFSASAAAQLAARASATIYGRLSAEAVANTTVGTSFSSLLFESLAAVLAASPDGQYGSYLSTIGGLGDTVAQIVTDVGDPSDPTAQTSADLLDGKHYMPAFGILLDPDLCPTQFLPYTAQFAGVQIPVGSDDAMARAAIRRESGFQRGTVASMHDAALAAMTAPGTNPYLVIQERTGGGAGSVVNPNDASDYPYHMIVAMRADQSGLPAGTYTSADTSYALIAAVEAVKPGGIQITFSVSDGYVWGTATNEWSADTFSWQAAQNIQP